MSTYRVWHAHREANVNPTALTPTGAVDRKLTNATEFDDFCAAAQQHGIAKAVLRSYVARAWGYATLALLLLVVNPLVPLLIGHFVTTLGTGQPVTVTAWLLVGVVAASAMLRFATTAQIRLLVYRIDFGVERLLFRRLLAADANWLSQRNLAASGTMRQIPAQLSQYAFVVELVLLVGLLVAYFGILVGFFGWSGIVVAALIGLGAWLGALAVRWLNRIFKTVYDSSHNRLSHVDALWAHADSLKRSALLRPLLVSLQRVRSTQMAARRTAITRTATVGLTKGIATDVALVVAAALQVWHSSGLSAGEGIALLVLTRMALHALDDALMTYASVRFAGDVGADAEDLVRATNAAAPVVVSDADHQHAYQVVAAVTAGGHSAQFVTDSAAGAVVAQASARVLRAAGHTVTVVGRGHPWPEGSIAEVVTLWHQPVDEQWYRECLFRSGLVDDVAVRECGDAEALPAAAESLSDGQQARLALAQALYSRPDVLILDDVLAPLDDAMALTVLGRLRGLAAPVQVVLVTPRGEHQEYFTNGVAAQPQSVTDVNDPAAEVLLGAARQYQFTAEYVRPPLGSFDQELLTQKNATFWGSVRALWPWPRLVVLFGVHIVAAVLGLVMASRLDAGVRNGAEVLAVAGVAVGVLAVTWACTMFPGLSCVGVLDRLHTALLGRAFFGETATSRAVLGSRVGPDFDDVEGDLTESLCAMLSTGVMFAVTFWALSANSWFAVLPLVLITVVGVWAFVQSQRARVRGSQLVSACGAPTRSFVAKVLGASGYHQSSLAGALARRLDDLSAVHLVAFLRSSAVMIRLLLTMEVLGVAVFSVGVAVAVFATGSGAWLGAGVVVFAAYAFSQQLSLVIETFMNAQTSLTGVARVAAVFGRRDLPVFADLRAHRGGAVSLVPDAVGATPVPGELVCAQLVPAVPVELRPVPVSLVASPGEWVFLVGATGSGKSSVLRTLAGAPAALGEWSWRVPGVAAADQPDMGPVVSFVAADVVDVPLTVGDCVSGQVAGVYAQLCAVVGCEQLDAVVPLAEVSMADRQVVNLALGVAAGPLLLLLDEATSALSAAEERRVFAFVRERLPDAVVVAALHRHDNRDVANQIIELLTQHHTVGTASGAAERSEG